MSEASVVPTRQLVMGFYYRIAVYTAVMLILPFLFLAWHPLLMLAVGVVTWTQAMLLLGIALTPASPGFADTVELQPGRDAKLYELVREVAGKVGGPVPTEIRLAADGKVRLVPLGGGPFREARWVVVIGFGALVWLSEDELRAVLAREQARFVGSEPRDEAWLVAMLTTIDQTRYFQAWMLFGVLHQYARGVRQVRAKRRALLLPRGDEAAARVVGREAADAALIRRGEAENLTEWFLERAVVPMLGSGLTPPLFSGLRAFASEPAVVAELDTERRAEVDRYEPGWPTIGSRVHDAGSWRVGGPARSGQDAVGRLGDVEAVEIQLVGLL